MVRKSASKPSASNRLVKLLKYSKRPVIVSGPYNSYGRQLFADALHEAPQALSIIPFGKEIGICLALFDEEGRSHLTRIAHEYASVVPKSAPLALVGPSFRLPHKYLARESLANQAVHQDLAGRGLEALLHAEKVLTRAFRSSGRNRANTVLTMSVGPPFDCYHGEHTPTDIDEETLPQVFGTVRHLPNVDSLLFETIPSVDAAVAAARAFTTAHKPLHLQTYGDSGGSTKLQRYLGGITQLSELQGVSHITCPSYNSETKTYKEIEPTKSYVISFNVDGAGMIFARRRRNPKRFERVSLQEAIRRLKHTVSREGLFAPAAIVVNCNSPAMTENNLVEGVDGAYSNRAMVDDPHAYPKITQHDQMGEDAFIRHLQGMREHNGLKIIGGCCGVTPSLVGRIAREVR